MSSKSICHPSVDTDVLKKVTISFLVVIGLGAALLMLLYPYMSALGWQTLLV
jgi:hypothetical protein